MIEDIYFKRYPNPGVGYQFAISSELQVFLNRAAQIIFDDLRPNLPLDDQFFKVVALLLMREIGISSLAPGRSFTDSCGVYLFTPYDSNNDAHNDAGYYFSTRVSLVELVFRYAELKFEEIPEEKLPALKKNTILTPRQNKRRKELLARSDARRLLRRSVDELNSRFRESGIPLRYHNGIIQSAADDLIEAQFSGPCWQILSHPRWRYAENQLKEAFDHVDTGRPDAAHHASKALESVVKIISDERKFTTGRENGAANFIDNLVSQRNGRFIEVWESEMLKAFFRDVRNPQAHGAGSVPVQALSAGQMSWAIDFCMIWMKSLILRF